ncbi:MAG: NAD(P)-dependent glycerol-3-phosphate dehydrogenase [candidate division Zixibacteria bacterium]|nr:NAD(P)-dependent glycerol-3-phosphate dehydrogenase [candidate division Zixibacteria bacterium]MDH4034995.1 NAD(P)-dependent glycerol-3-phosphate dehydrogenase [candidate division Zixibacteria bacterium]
MSERVAILGAGSWGMAIARLLDSNGADVRLWEFDKAEHRKLIEHRTIPEKLKDACLAMSIDITNDLGYAVSDCDLVVLAVPSQMMRAAIQPLGGILPKGTALVSLAKGVEVSSLRRMSEVIQEGLAIPAESVATLSGPSHAEEVVRDMPTTVVAASESHELVDRLQTLFSSRTFRVYTSDDTVGVELGGALKNIIAIGVGITDGLGLGDNTRGALITRGLAEMSRLGVAMGARAETFAGLSGIGDLVTTCISKHSRNRYVGEKIGQGVRLDEVLKSMAMVAEGVQTTRSGYQLRDKYKVEMPITTQVHQVLFEDKPAADAVAELMGRELKAEIWR